MIPVPQAAVDEMQGGLTVVIPTYNHGHFIGDALDSVVRQTRRPDKVIVFDDASTDNTQDIVRGYQERWGFIQLVRLSQNQGVIALLNKGLEATETEFVSFLAADDFVDDTLYEKSLALLQRHPDAALCGVLARLVDKDGKPLPRPADIILHGQPCYLPPTEALQCLYRHGTFFSGNGAVYRTARLRQIGGFDKALSSLCDGYAQQLLAAKHGFCFVPEVLASWRRLDAGYAVSTQRESAKALDMLHAVLGRIDGTDATVFPESYKRRLANRTRFMAAIAAISAPGIDIDGLLAALGLSATRFRALAGLAGRIFGRRGLTVLIGCWLRPQDMPRAMLRRFRMVE